MMLDLHFRSDTRLTAAQLRELGLRGIPSNWFDRTKANRTADGNGSYGERLYRLLRSPSRKVREQAAELTSEILAESRERQAQGPHNGGPPNQVKRETPGDLEESLQRSMEYKREKDVSAWKHMHPVHGTPLQEQYLESPGEQREPAPSSTQRPTAPNLEERIVSAALKAFALVGALLWIVLLNIRW